MTLTVAKVGHRLNRATGNRLRRILRFILAPKFISFPRSRVGMHTELKNGQKPLQNRRPQIAAFCHLYRPALDSRVY